MQGAKLSCTLGAADLPTALARVSFTWLVSQPVAAAQLVLVTAAEGRSLVGATNFASVLPLAATGKCPLCCWHGPSTAAFLLCCRGGLLVDLFRDWIVQHLLCLHVVMWCMLLQV